MVPALSAFQKSALAQRIIGDLLLAKEKESVLPAEVAKRLREDFTLVWGTLTSMQKAMGAASPRDLQAKLRALQKDGKLSLAAQPKPQVSLPSVPAASQSPVVPLSPQGKSALKLSQSLPPTHQEQLEGILTDPQISPEDLSSKSLGLMLRPPLNPAVVTSYLKMFYRDYGVDCVAELVKAMHAKKTKDFSQG